MTPQIAEQASQNPVITIITSGVVAAVVAGIFALMSKRNEYVNDYYKNIIKRRMAAYEQLEQNTIRPLKTSRVFPDKSEIHSPFVEPAGWDENVESLLAVMSTHGLWLSSDVLKRLEELNGLLFQKPSNIQEFGKENHGNIAKLREDLEQALAKDMLELHDVRAFLQGKNKKEI